MIRNEMEEIRTMVRQQGQQQQQAAQPQSAAAAAQTPQLALLQQQMTALSIIVMGQHQALVPQDPALAALQQQANLSGYGSPARGTPPVYPGGTGAVPEYMHLGKASCEDTIDYGMWKKIYCCCVSSYSLTYISSSNFGKQYHSWGKYLPIHF